MKTNDASIREISFELREYCVRLVDCLLELLSIASLDADTFLAAPEQARFKATAFNLANVAAAHGCTELVSAARTLESAPLPLASESALQALRNAGLLVDCKKLANFDDKLTKDDFRVASENISIGSVCSLIEGLIADEDHLSFKPVHLLSTDRTILLVEDDPETSMLLTFTLEEAGVKVQSVDNGFECLQYFQTQTEAAKSIDCVLTDVRMPVLDGYQLTKKLRDAGFAGIVVAMTGTPRPEEEQKAYSAGCDAYIAKGKGIGQIITLLDNL